MSNPNDDPNLRAFLNQQAKPTASPDEMARLAEHTKRNPPKKSGEAAMWGGGGIFVVFIVIKILSRILRSDHQDENNYQPPQPAPAAVSPAELNALMQKFELEKGPQTNDTP